MKGMSILSPRPGYKFDKITMQVKCLGSAISRSQSIGNSYSFAVFNHKMYLAEKSVKAHVRIKVPEELLIDQSVRRQYNYLNNI